MDVFTILMAIIVIMVSIQFKLNWVAFGTVLLVIVTLRNLPSTIIMIIALIGLYLTAGEAEIYWPWLMIGLIVLALLIGAAEKPQAEAYPPDLGGLLGGGLGGI
jgi:hypothetical protein